MFGYLNTVLPGPRLSASAKSLTRGQAGLCLLAFMMLAGGTSADAFSANVNGCCGGELWNGFENPDPNNPVGFEVDYTGDLTGSIPAQMTGDNITDPFEALNEYNGSPVNPITVVFDSVANLTRVTFSGGALPGTVPATCVPPQTPPGCWPIPTYNNNYHFGVNGGYGPPTAPLFNLSQTSTHWIYPKGTLELPGLIAYYDGGFSKKGKEQWVAVFIQDATGHVGGWQLLPTKPGEPIKFSIRNRGNTPITIGLLGYELGLSTPQDPACKESPDCSENIAALDSLGPEAFPPPGQPGSRFVSVKPPKKPLQPGEIITVKAR